MRLAVSSGLLLLLFAPTLSVFGQAVAPPASELQLLSSDKKLVQAFNWAKAQALVYAHDSVDPVGPWYEAALPGRDAFCIRDVSHQTTGAAALGLYAANHNMLERFADAVSPARDWAGYWEIDKLGRPSPADYVSDRDFWYNLPANFDLLDAAIRMWRWTGDVTYLDDAPFQRLFRTSSTDYVRAWELEPLRILSRPRIMNRRQRAGRFVQARGIPSYTEGRNDFNVGTDLLAAEYRAFASLRIWALQRKQKKRAEQYGATADSLLRLIEQKAWSEKDHHFAGFLFPDGRTQGSGDAMALYFGATRNRQHIRAALSRVESPAYLNSIGIEEESYLPETFYRYDESDAAYATIMDLANPNKERREYPEVPFSVVNALVTGMMGVQMVYDSRFKDLVLQSLARLKDSSDTATMKGIRIQTNHIDLEHAGDRKSALTNRSGPTIYWQAAFPGNISRFQVDGHSVPAHSTTGLTGAPYSYVLAVVTPGATVTVTAAR